MFPVVTMRNRLDISPANARLAPYLRMRGFPSLRNVSRPERAPASPECSTLRPCSTSDFGKLCSFMTFLARSWLMSLSYLVHHPAGPYSVPSVTAKRDVRHWTSWCAFLLSAGQGGLMASPVFSRANAEASRHKPSGADAAPGPADNFRGGMRFQLE